MRINVNTANAEEQKQIPGIGDKVAQLLIQFRDTYGVVKREALNLALRGNLSSEVVDLIDFSVPKLNDPFEIDLHCLPSVPSAGNGRSHSRQMRPNIGLGDEILPLRSPRE